MKAAVFHAPNTPLTIEQVEIDKPGPREVLIRTSAAGMCHSDLHFIEGKYPTPVPIVLGHESAGIVEAVGRDVTYVKPGDHVITCLSVFCGHCEFCLTGHMSICQTPEVKLLPGKAKRMRWKGAHAQPVPEPVVVCRTDAGARACAGEGRRPTCRWTWRR
jgi:S-(hydroxymethyl)glutathione dehydrogenase/alcohol dehydrogenase